MNTPISMTKFPRARYCANRQQQVADRLSDMKPWTAARVISAMIRLQEGKISPCDRMHQDVNGRIVADGKKSWDECLTTDTIKINDKKLTALILWFNDKAGSTALIAIPVCGSVNG